MSLYDKRLRDLAINVAFACDVRPVDIMRTNRRKRKLVHARWSFWWLAKTRMEASNTRLQMFYEKRGYSLDHSSIIHAMRRIEQDPSIVKRVDTLKVD